MANLGTPAGTVAGSDGTASATIAETAIGDVGPGVLDEQQARRARMASASRFALPALLLLFVLVFSLLRPETFATVENARTVLSTQSVLAVLALSALMTLTIGEFDLSIGFQLGLAAILVPGLTAKQGLGIPEAILIAVAATTAIGFLNGLLVARVKINSFIATIGMGALVNALILAYSGGNSIFEGVPPELLSLASTRLLGLPLPIFYVLAIAVVLWFVMQRTPFGRFMAAVGGSKDAARLAGINVDRVTLLAFTLTGMLAGIAGAIQAAQLGTGNPSIGPDQLLPAFAAAFLGATSFRVGTFNVWGTLTAVITIAAGVAGLNLLGLPEWVNPCFNGAALILAVTATRYLRGKSL